jgi:hypothetical protein
VKFLIFECSAMSKKIFNTSAQIAQKGSKFIAISAFLPPLD